MGSPTSPENYFPENDEKSIKTIFKITDDFILYPQENRYLLINFPSLFVNFIKLNFKSITESSLIPLLIGEPYKLESEELRVFFKIYGFTLEKIDNEKMILLTIPSYLTELPFRKIAGTLIKFFSNKEKNINSFSRKDFNLDEINLSFSQIKFLIKSFESNLLNEDFVRILDDNVLNSLFYPI